MNLTEKIKELEKRSKLIKKRVALDAKVHKFIDENITEYSSTVMVKVLEKYNVDYVDFLTENAEKFLKEYSEKINAVITLKEFLISKSY